MNTPETDALFVSPMDVTYTSAVKLSARLERERDEARADALKAHVEIKRLSEVCGEAACMRGQLDRFRRVLEEVSAHCYTKQDAERCRAMAKEALE